MSPTQNIWDEGLVVVRNLWIDITKLTTLKHLMRVLFNWDSKMGWGHFMGSFWGSY